KAGEPSCNVSDSCAFTCSSSRRRWGLPSRAPRSCARRQAFLEHAVHPPSGIRMRMPRVDDVVCLTEAIPELWLQRGDQGVVKSIWLLPAAAYEVEFHSTSS